MLATGLFGSQVVTRFGMGAAHMITLHSLSPQAAAGVIGLAFTAPVILALLIRVLVKVVVSSKP